MFDGRKRTVLDKGLDAAAHFDSDSVKQEAGGLNVRFVFSTRPAAPVTLQLLTQTAAPEANRYQTGPKLRFRGKWSLVVQPVNSGDQIIFKGVKIKN